MQQLFKRVFQWPSHKKPRCRKALTIRSIATATAMALASAAALVAASAASAQTDESSLASIPDHFQAKGASLGGFEAQAPHEAISTFTGKLHYSFTDLLIPGNGGMDLKIQRSYDSIDDPIATLATWGDYEYSPVGLGWTMHMGRVIRGANKALCSSSWAMASANPVLELPDGSRQILYEQSAAINTWMTKDFWQASCAGGQFNVRSPDGTTYEMATAGHMFGAPGSKQKAYYPSRITDRNGNWFRLDYQFLPYGNLALSQISTSDGRSVQFQYAGSTLSKIIDVASNREWRYSYLAGVSPHMYLAAVTRPDGLSWKYSYNAVPGRGSMSRVEYPTGGRIDYTYDHVDFRAGTPRSRPSTVIASKTARVDAAGTQSGTWRWNYEVATDELPNRTEGGIVTHTYSIPPEVRSQINATTVTDPLGHATEHFHMGIHSVRQSPPFIGTYIGSTSDVEHIILGYQEIEISDQQDVVANMFSNDYFYPAAMIEDQRRHFRAGELYSITRSGYDSLGNPSTIQEEGSNNTDRTYIRTTNLGYNVDTSKWLIRQVASQTVTVDGQTDTTTRQFGGSGNVLSQTVAGVTSTATYHDTGDVQTQTNAKGQTTTFNDYHRGIARTEVQPEGVTITRQVDPAGNITAETNGRGKTTAYTYDGLNRLTAIKRPTGSPTTVTWTATTRNVQRGGMLDSATYDGLGRLVRRQVSAPGETPIWVNFAHDITGQRVFQSYPNSAKGTGYRYDPLGRVITTLHDNTAGTDSASNTEYTNYYSLLIQNQDSTNRATLDYFRAFGNPGERHFVRNIAGPINNGQLYPRATADITLDLRGQIKTVTMDGKTRSYGYDSRYYLVSRTDPETGLTHFGRDALGNLSSKAIAAGPATSYSYDERNRLSTITYPASEGTAVPQAPAVAYSYNNSDLPVSITAGDVQRSYSYDDNDQLQQESLRIASGPSQTLRYYYNASDALASITYPSGNQVHYNPDAYGRARSALPYVTSVSYHANGMPSTIQYANGVVSSMGLNSRQWPAGLKYSKGASSFINSTYEYDLVGNLKLVNESADTIYSRSFVYDQLNRLTAEVIWNGGSLPDAFQQYYYDSIGNLTASIRQSPNANAYSLYEYDSTTGLLSGVTGEFYRAFEYDTAGNVRANGQHRFGYDRANNMRCVDCTTASPRLHSYDASNTRVQTSEGSWSAQYLHNKQGLLMQTLEPRLRKEHIYLGRRQVAERRTDLP